jgi:ATPase subunit of ABC transporter with duplicated ATPase domains
MSQKPIQIKHLTLSFPHKICFEDFSAEIPFGSKIAIIGRNGSGKTSLLRLLRDTDQVSVGYVPQVIETSESLSGGQRFNEALTKALSIDPELLLLDEPTNHLDTNNKKSLMRMLNAYQGTLIIVSHDVALLRQCIDTLWHIEQCSVNIFSGNYDDYLQETNIKRVSVEKELGQLEKQKKEMHQLLMKEQTRAAKSKAKGEKSIDQRKWPTIVSKSKALQASETSGRKKSDIRQHKTELMEQLSSLRLAEIIIPTFSLNAADVGERMLVSIREASVYYQKETPILNNIYFSVSSTDRVAMSGANGSGKSTLVKAILQDPNVIKSGEWYVPKREDIGYLDQHYGTLPPGFSVLKCIQMMRPEWTPVDVRRHLNDFLFRKNDEINAKISTLSGGEKARLSLAQIAAKTPKLLILDEVTNNLDLETREHVIQVLRAYPGGIILISHDEDFLCETLVEKRYCCQNGQLVFGS